MGGWIRVRGDCWLFVPEFAFSYNFLFLFSSFIILLLIFLLFDDDNSSILLFCSLTITVFRLSGEREIRSSIASGFSILFRKSVFGFLILGFGCSVFFSSSFDLHLRIPWKLLPPTAKITTRIMIILTKLVTQVRVLASPSAR